MPLTLPLNQVSVIHPQHGAIGSVIGFLHDQQLVWGWAVGREGQATHAVVADELGLPVAWALNHLGTEAVLSILPGSALVLEVDSNAANVRTLHSYIGCLAISDQGLILCVGGARDPFQRRAPVYVSMATGLLRDEDDRAWMGRAVWLTNWTLSLRGADEQLTRIAGNPPWPEVARIQR